MAKKAHESVWVRVWAWVRTYVLAPIPMLVVAGVGIFLVLLGAKNIQVGGLLGRLSGRRKEGQKAVDAANSIPEDRVHDDGTLIPQGEPDSRGIAQARVVRIEKPGLFGDPSKVKIKDPDTGKKIEIDLPDGVKARDVKRVVVVRPEVTVVEVKSESPVTGRHVDDLLSKYGGS